MTQPGVEQGSARCRWCSRPFATVGGPGRPRLYCKRACRQRDFEARRRAKEAGLADHELVVTRRALSVLDDLVYVLACAVEDVERQDIDHQPDGEVREALEWLLEAARPLAARSRAGTLLTPPGNADNCD